MPTQPKKKILLCSPDYFTVEYVINPWMKVGSVDQKLAKKQWEKLVQLYLSLGVELEYINQDPHLPDMVFTADQGIVRDNHVYLSHFRYPQRQPETELFKKWFNDHGYSTEDIGQNDFFEGGECVFWRDLVFVGTGFRAQMSVCPKLEQLLQQKVIGLELIDEFFYHLDTCFFALNDDMAFFYPPAFSAQSVSLLTSLISELIPFTTKEAYNFAANSVVLDNTVVTTPSNPIFADQLKEHGYTPAQVEISEFMKSGGGIHCLSLQLN